MIKSFFDGRVVVKVGDITVERTDAIVNAANSTLLGGGGVDGAIHRKGGPQILAECKKLRDNEFPQGLPTGEAVITSGGNLPAKYVIHTVGPIYGSNDGRDAVLLAKCYINSLNLAIVHNVETIAFPSISTGVYGYPKHEAAKVVSTAIAESLAVHTSLAEVRLVFYSEADAEIFLRHSAL